ncbi:GNAT family N-acetyltransferase [Vibrio tapetis]|uniref:Putative Acyl-CoA N-acyltransferase n=1 Tax=Vibrio tapetis subsp. tapetis TaxID=1671868 RepID=A0A2N8ZKS3_9VIBR|nr:GNAT family N-acetyltransferase [Vibrio tapetis]SON52492.1 putative Acyl-CoA N-acyltransferase [Vibrio tapetis subsp. tapetis]
MIIEVTHHPEKKDIEILYKGLSEFNKDFFPDLSERPIALFLRDSNGQVEGGLTGRLHYNSLHIQRLWLSSSIRGKGLGAKILSLAEKEARKHEAQHIFLDTYNFQAPQFYLKQGFTEVGRYVDFPKTGTDKIFYKKTLV